MSHIICTHCMTAVPHGATVCRGCKAEIEYGVSQGMYTVLSVASALLPNLCTAFESLKRSEERSLLGTPETLL